MTSLVERRYATPVDAQTIAIRRLGEVPEPAITPLQVLPSDTPDVAQVVVRLPVSASALDIREAAAVRPYFSWEESSSFWWHTQRPAWFRLERLTPTMEVGHLEQRGLVLPAGNDPRRRPSVQYSHMFSVYRSVPRYSAMIADPFGPDLVRDRTGDIVLDFESEVSRASLARFPGLCAEVLWLRMLRSETAERDVVAFRKECHALDQLDRLGKTAVTNVVLMGELDTERYSGPFVALRRPIGLDLQELLTEVHRLRPNDALGIASSIAIEVAQTLAGAHRLGYYAGILSPGLLRVRPLSGTTGYIARSARASVVALPAIGRSGESLEGSIRRMPTTDGPYLGGHPRLLHKHGPLQDLRSLGYFLWHMLELAEVNRHPLRELASHLVTGRIDSIERAIHLLDAA